MISRRLRVGSWVAAMFFTGAAAISAAATDDAILLSPGEVAVRIGAYSPFAPIKQRLEDVHAQCVSKGPAEHDPPLRLASATRRMTKEVAACLSAARLPARSPAHGGAITAELWRAIAPDLPLPTLADRVEALTLSFEATDFSDPPEWNFCQDTPGSVTGRAERVAAGEACFNATDPCSMLTWGPRGATAGQGGEIQWILWRLYRRAPQLVATAFGPELPNLKRFLELRRPPATHCDGTSPLEHFMCAVWVDPHRRRLWEDALRSLSRFEATRRAYHDVYAAHEFDGYKLAAYFGLWRSLGLAVSEIDFALFFDRATHSGAPPVEGGEAHNQLRTCLASDKAARKKNAAARRCLALAQPHPTQPIDRLGRDVSYYRAAFPPEALSAKERETWQHHIPLDAALNFGLSDERDVSPEAAIAAPVAEADRPPQVLDALTEAERSCPASIRMPQRRMPP